MRILRYTVAEHDEAPFQLFAIQNYFFAFCYFHQLHPYKLKGLVIRHTAG